MRKLSVILVLALMLTSVLALGSFAGSTDLATAAAGKILLNDHVKQDSIAGSVTGFDNEGPVNLFDNDTATKFCTNEMPCEITWTMDASYVVGGFVIATANDNAEYNGRNPATYTLYGSQNDGTDYVALYSGTEADLAEENFTYFLVEFTNNVGCPYYKLEIDSSTSGTLQVSEFILIQADTSGSSYPSSGLVPATGSLLGIGLIGNETGWGDNADAGRAAAFDGSGATYFDPLAVADGYCGIDCGEPYTLTQVNILSRDGQLPRFLGAMIQGSNVDSADAADWTTLYTSDSEATAFEWNPITTFENNTGYRYYRYYNETSHGDVADLEFYGVSVSGAPEAAAAAAAASAEEAAAAAVVETPAAAETAAPVAAAQTADLLVFAVIAMVGTAVVIKKRK